MALHVPKLPHDARPPLGWPPEPSWTTSASALAILCCVSGLRVVVAPRLYSALVSLSSSTLPQDVALWPLDPPTALAAADLALLLLAGFFFTSNVVLKRSMLLGDRYGGRTEVMKLLLSSLPLAGIGVGVGIGPISEAKDNSNASTSTASLFPYLIFAFSFFAGLHFVYGDTTPLLQGFGCKWSVPARWHTCTRAERTFGASLLAIVGGLLAYVAAVLGVFSQEARDDGGASSSSSFSNATNGVDLLQVYILASCFILLPLFRYRATHSFHMHHYVCALAAIPVTRLSRSSTPSSPDIVALCLQGLLLGMFSDGVSVWGMDPLFVKKELEEEDVQLMKVDVPTVLWTHMLPLFPSPLKWLYALERMQIVFEGVECAISVAAGKEKGKEKGKVQTPNKQNKQGVNEQPLLLALLNEIGYEKMARSTKISDDVELLRRLLALPPRRRPLTSPSGSSGSSVVPAERQIVSAFTAALKEASTLHSQKDRDIVTSSVVAAALGTLFLAPLAGARELRMQSELHLTEGGVGIEEERERKKRRKTNQGAKGESRKIMDGAGVLNPPAMLSSLASAKAMFSYGQVADASAEAHTTLHASVRRVLAEWEAKALAGPGRDAYLSTVWAMCEGMLKLLREAAAKEGEDEEDERETVGGQQRTTPAKMGTPGESPTASAKKREGARRAYSSPQSPYA